MSQIYIQLGYVLLRIAQLLGFVAACYFAYQARLHAVNNFGRVIHEFDPYFNLRATEYLVDNGWTKFNTWYDDRSWYPLGRPVGTTIYPGLQITAAVIYHVVNSVFDIPISINDVCVYIPAWFSIVTCMFVFGMAYESSGHSVNAGVVAAFIMAVIPAHIMRSVAGGYDNESIAMGAMCSTFYLWMLSLRSRNSWPVGILTAISYIYMVAAWGGYVFVLNMIGVHAMYTVVIGGYTPQLHLSYSLFYVLGTLGAIQWPVVGLAPLKSLEQLGPMLVFLVLQVLFIFALRRERYPSESITSYRMFQLSLLGFFATALAVAVGVLAPMGYFGPLSSRIRGLFIRHTHTGNPLVDSVAEHQATQDGMYYQFFHSMCYIAPLALPSFLWKRSEAKFFMFVYALVAMYFSRKMNRLVLLLAPAASVLGGIAIAGIVEWSLHQFFEFVSDVLSFFVGKSPAKKEEAPAAAAASPSASTDAAAKDGKDSKKKDKKKETKASAPASSASASADSVSVSGVVSQAQTVIVGYYKKLIIVRVLVASGCLYALTIGLGGFWTHSQSMAVMLSNPSIILQGQTQTGQTVMLDDFREAYWWIRDNTPEDARVMSWLVNYIISYHIIHSSRFNVFLTLQYVLVFVQVGLWLSDFSDREPHHSGRRKHVES